MYPKWLVSALALLFCLFFVASAAPVSSGGVVPAKRLKQFQLRRPRSGGGIEARGDGTPVRVDLEKRTKPSPRAFTK